MESCIYCQRTFDATRGVGDHIIPAALGEFRYDDHFYRICPKCNGLIGRSEQEFLQCGPEGFYRRIVQPAIRRRGKSGAPSSVGAHGMPPPRHVATCGDHTELVELAGDGPRDVKPIDQLVIPTKDGDDHYVPLYHGMRPEQLRERVSRAGITTFEMASFQCDDALYDEYATLVKATWPHMQLTPQPSMAAGVHTVKGRITFTFTDHYFRAIAKVAFHYYLVHSRRGTRGDEPEFDPIRRFILEGGNVDSFFPDDLTRFVVPFGELRAGCALLPSTWCHTLAADESSEDVVAYVHLFAGPEAVRKGRHIRLGRVPGSIVVPGSVWGHVYQYDNDESGGRYAGQVRAVSLNRLA